MAGRFFGIPQADRMRRAERSHDYEKDKKRIYDLISKAMWSRTEMSKLAVTMCKLITKPKKAFERGKVAQEILGPSNIVSIIFYSRAIELGQNIGYTPEFIEQEASQIKQIQP